MIDLDAIFDDDRPANVPAREWAESLARTASESAPVVASEPTADSATAATVAAGTPAVESVSAIDESTPTDAAPTTNPADWRETLTPTERGLFGTDAEPSANFINTALAVRAVFDCEIVGVTAPACGPDPDAAAVESAEADAASTANGVRLPDRADDSPEEWREVYEERAGIMEFHGNLSQKDAERGALADTLRVMQAATKRTVLNGGAGT